MLGLTYKPNTDDMRDAPSLVIVPRCSGGRARSSPIDPEGANGRNRCCPASSSPAAPTPASRARTRLVVVTEWDEFRALDLARVKAACASRWSIDLRNIYPIKEMKALGFRYVCVGRGFGGEG